MSENIEAALRLPFDNTYARLPNRFSARIEPTPVARPRLIKLNRRLAVTLGLDPDDLASPEGVEALAGNRVPEGAEPLPWHTRGTSSGISCRSSATGGPPARGGRRPRRRATRHSSEGLRANAVLARRRRKGGPRPGSARVYCQRSDGGPRDLDHPCARCSRLEEEPEHASSRRTAMQAVNPAFIPRNHQVEAAIVAAVQRTVSILSSNS